MLLTDRKMEILKELEGEEKTPTELSNEMGLTISSITKHLKELEEMDLIVQSGRKEGKTRSYTKYKLKDFIYFAASIDGKVQKKVVEPDQYSKVLFKILSIPQNRFHKPLEKFWQEVQDDLEKIDGLMVYGSVARGDARKDSDIDLLIISDSEKLESEYGAKVIGGKMFMAKVFSKEEFRQNLKKGSDFALSALKEGILLYDTERFLQGLKNSLNDDAEFVVQKVDDDLSGAK